MFKHHKYDSLLVLITLAQVGLLLLPFVTEISLLGLCALVVLNVFLIGTNYQCVAHNFIHNPFFKDPALNRGFSLINSLGIGLPQSLYRIHHIEHHRHNNNPERDESSTYFHGKFGQEENIFSYSILGVLRTDLVMLYKQARNKSILINLEVIFFVAFLVLLAQLNWRLTLGYVVTSYVLGQIFALWENYCEHHFADYTDRKRDSVSCYNSLYNLIWFNNGFHQEHHFAPQIHWTMVPQMMEKLPQDRVIVDFCHLSNSFSAYRQNKKRPHKVALRIV